ncbi:MAG: GNAT family N-acetyltransferase [Symploca sp. SIO1A3]|nr:GNAT family N-acetyltransferase [Symploca sp. SIO1A3]
MLLLAPSRLISKLYHYLGLFTVTQALVSEQILPGYRLRPGQSREQATLVKFMQLSYQELFPEQDDFSHLAITVGKYFSQETPLWWVELAEPAVFQGSPTLPWLQPIACLWLGNAVDQIQCHRHAHVFLLYVMPEYRRQGIGSALMRYAEDWARARGDRKIGLQVFQRNQAALLLYERLGYQTQSLWMVKPLES